MKKKILFVHFRGELGGAPSSLSYLIENLPKEEIHSTVLCPRGPVTEKFREIANEVVELDAIPPFFVFIEGVNQRILRNIWSNLNCFGAYQELIQKIKEIDPDIVHFNDYGFFPVLRAVKKNGYQVVLHARCVPASADAWFHKYIDDSINKNVDALICITKTVQHRFAAVEKSTVVYNSIPNIKTDRAAYVKEERKSSEVMTCLFAANFVEAKGIYEIIEAAKKLKDEPIVFLLAGKNSRPAEFYQSPLGKVLSFLKVYPDIEEDLRVAIRKDNLKIELLGYVKDMPSLFQKADVLIAPEYSNSTPRSVYEAGLYEVPAVLALRDKIEDVVVTGKTGFLVPIRDADKLAERIKYLQRHPDERVEMGKNARLRSLKLHNPTTNANEVLQVYRNILNKTFKGQNNQLKTLINDK